MARNSDRKDTIMKMYMIAIIGIVIGLLFIVFYLKESRLSTVAFNENSNVDYKVFLKENKFYDKEYLEKDNQYIASLINKIETKFNYNMDIPNRFDYVYGYRVDALVEVKDVTNDNTIYKFQENLVEKKNVSNSGILKINDTVNIDYPKYNDLISSFKNTYELNNAKGTLKINMYLDFNGTESNSKTIKNKKVASLELPLVENTISINKVNTNGSIKYDIGNVGIARVFLVFGILILITGLVYIAYIIYYSIKSRTAEMIYQKELKNITTNYDSYIQKISDKYDIGTSQVIKIKTFNDILEIRDTLKQPILMLENERKNGTFFIIPATNSIIYVYALRLVDIEAKLEGREVPVFDVTEIPHTDFTVKKYTEDFIKEEITRTAMMPKVDEENVIKGNKDSEKSLYDQLELTQSFSVDEIKRAVKKAKKRKENRQKKKTK